MILIGIILFAIGISISFIATDCDARVVVGTIFMTIGTMIFILGGYPTPTAMDVYRGRTTLEITYKDGVAMDSVVVFKDKEK